jgi:mono/diheme cytochrome c family protein
MSEMNNDSMAEQPNANSDRKVHGTVAEFTDVDSLMSACAKVRDAGYTKTDAFTPFPVHGIDKALGIKPTILPWIVLVCGLTGTAVALTMQIWMNAIDYPYIISGKPYISLPAFIPVAFELTILFASFGTFFGMWILNGLPKFSNPVFTDPRFDRVTDDRFFLYIDAKDPKYNKAEVEKLFGGFGSEYIQSVVEDDSEKKIPAFMYKIWIAVAAVSIIPLLIGLKMRVTNSSQPRFHIFFDMDFSPSKDAQQNTTLFADARAMRPDVPGTVARGQQDINFRSGIDMDALAAIDVDRAQYLVRLLDEDQEPVAGDESQDAAAPAAAPAGGDNASVMDTTPWLTENPVGVSESVLLRGQEQFGIYCAVCHGLNGGGNGLVNRRAQRILAATWVPPSKLHDESLHEDVYPDGKLFSTISNGIRKMPGYSAQIKAKDRWAIVAYVRALQRSQDATIDLVPEDKVEMVKEKQAEVQAAIQAEADKANAGDEGDAESGDDASEPKDAPETDVESVEEAKDESA